MTLKIGDTEISRIGVIDDERDVREMYGLTVEEMDLTPVSQDEPLSDLEAFATSFVAIADAAICDHNLRPRRYSPYNGAELVAKWYVNHFPAVLCTRYQGASVDELRRWRRFIPSLIGPEDLNPDTISDGLEQCVGEFHDRFRPSRKPWRALISVEQVETEVPIERVFVTVPSWTPHKVISLQMEEIPASLRDKVVEGARLHAMVNLGADSLDMLYFRDWEDR